MLKWILSDPDTRTPTGMRPFYIDSLSVWAGIQEYAAYISGGFEDYGANF